MEDFVKDLAIENISFSRILETNDTWDLWAAVNTNAYWSFFKVSLWRAVCAILLNIAIYVAWLIKLKTFPVPAYWVWFPIFMVLVYQVLILGILFAQQKPVSRISGLLPVFKRVKATEDKR